MEMGKQQEIMFMHQIYQQQFINHFIKKDNYNNFNISTSIETSINDLVNIISSHTKKYDMRNIKVEHAQERIR